MARYHVIEEWAVYRVIAIDAASEDEAIELVANGHGDEVDSGTDDHASEAVLVEEICK